MIPDKTKKGMAINEKLFRLETIFCAEVKTAFSKGITNNNVQIEEAAILIAIGIPTIKRIAKITKRIRPASRAITIPPHFQLFEEFYLINSLHYIKA